MHGIGEQERCSTLVQFCEPVYRWLDEWFLNVSRSWAHTGLGFGQYSEWGARQFEARKTFRELTHWLLTIIPWTLGVSGSE